MRYVLILLVLLSFFPGFAEGSKEKDRLASEKLSEDIFLKKEEQHWIDLVLADIVSESGKKNCYMIASKTRLIVERKTRSRLGNYYLVNGSRKSLEKRGINEADKLINMLISANNISYKILIPEEATCPKNGFMNDSSCTYYAEDKEVDAWVSCFQKNPDIRIIQLSVPVLYEKENIIMVYKFESGGSLDSQTTLVLYQLKDNKVNKILEILLSRS